MGEWLRGTGIEIRSFATHGLSGWERVGVGRISGLRIWVRSGLDVRPTTSDLTHRLEGWRPFFGSEAPFPKFGDQRITFWIRCALNGDALGHVCDTIDRSVWAMIVASEQRFSDSSWFAISSFGLLVGGCSMVRFQPWLANGLLWMVIAQAWALAGCVRAENPRVLLETSLGEVEVELYVNEAPGTVENFLKYAKKGHYDGTIFHRIIPNFVVQGGGLNDKMKELPTDDPIKNESTNGLKNEKYTLSMARTRAAHSATSQFYINLKNNRDLNRANAVDGVGYCVFGKVVKGEEIVDEMAKAKTGNKGGNSDVPIEPIYLVKATILEPAEVVEKK